MAKSRRDELSPEEKMIWDQPANEMAFTIERTRVETGLTFSAEAFEGFLSSVTSFIGSRAVKHWEEMDEPPVKMTVVVSVLINE